MKTLILCGLISISINTYSQATYSYEPSKENPYGKLHPDAPMAVADFEPLIGKSECLSESRKQDGTWNDPVDMLWTFKYIMNGNGVQDETLKANGAHSGSIRQYIADSARWYVHYYSNSAPSTTLPVWEGNREEGKIVLYRDQKAPNGTDGYFRLTFSDFTDQGYKWEGAWVSKDESVVFPTWRITCKKIER